MADNRNLEAVRNAYREWSDTRGRSSEAFFDLFADNIEMRTVLTGVDNELAKTHYTRDEARNYFAELARDWEQISYDCERYVGQGDDVVMIGRCAWRNRRSGKVLDTPKVDIWRFSGGKAVSFLEMFDSHGFIGALPEDEQPAEAAAPEPAMRS